MACSAFFDKLTWNGLIEMDKDYYSNNTEYYNKEYNSNDSFNWKPKLSLIIIIIIAIITIIIVEDELSGRNRIKPFFTYLQTKIDSLIKGFNNTIESDNITYSINSNADKSEDKNKIDSKITFSEVEKKYKEKYDENNIYECPICIVESELHMVRALKNIEKEAEERE